MNELNKIENDRINKLLDELKLKLIESFPGKISNIFIYGSYARNESSIDSDIDIFVLTTMSEKEIKATENTALEIALKLSLDYEIHISLIIKNINHFNKYVDALPFYSSIVSKGIQLYGK